MSLRALSTCLLTATALALVPARAAFAAWPADSSANVPVCTTTSDQSYPGIASNGAGGAYVMWSEGTTNSVYLQHLSAQGAPLWATNGLVVHSGAPSTGGNTILSDGAGGAILVFLEGPLSTRVIRAQRVSSSGAPLWPAGGVTVCSGTAVGDVPVIVSDGAGGAVVAWQDYRSGAAYDVYAQRISAAGAAVWTANGVALCTSVDDQYDLSIVADGAGGAIVTWQDDRVSGYDVYAQRINAAGVPQWTANGVAVAALASSQWGPGSVTDGAGGIIVTWTDFRLAGGVVCAQRVSGSGALLWAASGVVLAGENTNKWYDSPVSDGAGGAIAAWCERRWVDDGYYDCIIAQRVTGDGAVAWATGGVPLCLKLVDASPTTIVTDLVGGAIVTWEKDCRNPGYDVYAQRVSRDGVVLWPANGVPLCTASGAEQGTVLVSDGAGGAIGAWSDGRSGYLYNHDIYAQRVDRWGCLGAQPTITRVADHPDDEGISIDLTLAPSPEDGAAHRYVEQYWFWRQLPQLAALARGARLASADAQVSDPRATVRTTQHGGLTYYWECIGQSPAAGLPQYPVATGTAGDSMPGSNPLTYFMVEARNDAGTMWWFSDPVGGYSVDNLAPAAPSPFTGSYLGGTATLSWGASSATDFSVFRLYRGTSTAFVPGPGNLIRTQTGTGYVDNAGAPYIYKLTAVDIHGNESAATTLQPSGTADVPGAALPRELALSAPAPNPLRGSCTMRLALPRAAQVALAVYDQQGRRVRTLLAGALPTGEHPFVWDGRDDGGRGVASGIYFVRCSADGRTLTRRVTAIR